MTADTENPNSSGTRAVSSTEKLRNQMDGEPSSCGVESVKPRRSRSDDSASKPPVVFLTALSFFFPFLSGTGVDVKREFVVHRAAVEMPETWSGQFAHRRPGDSAVVCSWKIDHCDSGWSPSDRAMNRLNRQQPAGLSSQ